MGVGWAISGQLLSEFFSHKAIESDKLKIDAFLYCREMMGYSLDDKMELPWPFQL